MKTSLFILGVILMFSGVAVAQGIDDLKSQLEQSGQFTSQEVKDLEGNLTKLTDAGAPNEELKNMLVDLKQQGATTEDLKKVLDQTQKAIDEKVDPTMAVTSISDSASQAMQQGMKGKDLEDKLKETVDQLKQGGMGTTGATGEDMGGGMEGQEPAAEPGGGAETGTMGETGY